MKKLFIGFIIFVVTGLASAFLGSPGEATFVIGGICALLYFIFSPKKSGSTSRGTSQKASLSSSNNSSAKYRPSKSVDYWDQRNIPSHWAKARVCVDGDHDANTVSKGNASHCYKCGRPFDGVWGDRGVFDGYFCQIHTKWIPRGSYCLKCKNEGLIH